MYQGRWAKGILFFVCIMGTFAYGILLGSSRVVYTSMRQHDHAVLLLFARRASACRRCPRCFRLGAYVGKRLPSGMAGWPRRS